jgi:hypothetical protein
VPDRTRDDEFELLADLTSMLTLALDDDEDTLEAYIGDMQDEPGRLRSLLFSGMLLYAQAFARLGAEQGFDPVVVTRRIAIDEARERYGVLRSD